MAVFFVKPSWSPNFVGATVTPDGKLTRQEVNLGGHSNIGLAGATNWRNVQLILNNSAIVAVELEEPVSENVSDIRLAFQVIGKMPGDAILSAYIDGVAGATMQVSVNSQPASDAIYVDRFLRAFYDVDYKAQGGNYSKFLVLQYVDDVVVDLDIDRIVDGTADAAASSQMMANSTIADGGKSFPQQLNRITTPRLVLAKRAAIQTMDTEFLSFLVVAEHVVEFVIAAGQVMQLSGQVAAIRTPRTRLGLPPPVKQVIGPKTSRVTPAEVQEALDEARRENAFTTLYHGGNRDIPAGRPFSTTDSLEHARIYAQRSGGQVHRYEVPTARLRELERLQSNGQSSVQRMRDSLKGTMTNATEYRFSSGFLQGGGIDELVRYRQPLPVP